MNGAKKLINILQENGYEAYLVGGCVRDMIIGRKIHDYDICTSATPNDMLKVFKNFKVIETGLKHGTLTVACNEKLYEITTYRIDGEYLDFRRPSEVKFTTDLVKDLSRRDFTMNAIAYNDKNGLIDPFGGVKDIQNKVIKCVGNPDTRFNEDALRILRAIRFSAQLNYKIDNNTAHYILQNKFLLENISKERIRDELCKIVMSNNVKATLPFIQVYGVVVPELQKYYDCQYPFFCGTIKRMDMCNTNDLIVKLTILFDKLKYYDFWDIDLDKTFGECKIVPNIFTIENIMKNLKFDNKTIKFVCQLVMCDSGNNIKNDYDIKRLLNKIGYEQFNRLLQIKELYVDNKEVVPEIKSRLNYIIETQQCYDLGNLAINGEDLIDMGYKGQQIGIILDKVLDYIMKDNSKNNMENIKEYIRCNF